MWSNDPWPWFQASKTIDNPTEAKAAFRDFVDDVLTHDRRINASAG